MADADELARVWGPQGLATTDPSAIRAVPPTPPAPPAPPEPVRVVDAPPAATTDPIPAPPPRPRRSPKVLLAAAGVGVLAVAVVVALVLPNRAPSPGEDRLAADRLVVPATSTTIVSAAADLLLRRTDDERTPLPPITVPEKLVAPTTTEPHAAPQPDVAKAAAALSAAMNAADCDALWDLLSSRTQAFLTTAVRGTQTAPRAVLCDALREEAPRTSVAGPVRPLGADRAVVAMAADGDLEDITFVLEHGAWLVDLVAMQETRVASSAEVVQSMLQDAAATEATAFAEDGRFSDDTVHLDELAPGIAWRRGIAPVSAGVGDVYVQLGDGAVCLSAKAANGARFLLRRGADGATTYAGGEIPGACDSSPLASSW